MSTFCSSGEHYFKGQNFVTLDCNGGKHKCQVELKGLPAKCTCPFVNGVF